MISKFENERLFTFGCSFTNWVWPTWADILGKEFKFYENWGRPGSGNQYIFNSLLECNQRHKFTQQDHIIIMWSTVDREDRYVANTWIGNGNIYNQNLYSDDWVRQFACHRGSLIRDLATITAAKELLDYWGVNYTMLSIMPLADREDWGAIEENQDVVELYNSTLSSIKPSMSEILLNSTVIQKNRQFSHKIHTTRPDKELLNLEKKYNECAGKDWPSFDYFYKQKPIQQSILNDIKKFLLVDKLTDLLLGVDRSHPTPKEHLYYVQKIILDYKISDNTVNWIQNFRQGDYFKNHLPDKRL